MTGVPGRGVRAGLLLPLIKAEKTGEAIKGAIQVAEMGYMYAPRL